MKRLTKTLRLLLIGSFFSPLSLLMRAAFLLIVFGVFHLLGWRDDTRILSGTSLPSDAAVVRGLLYAAAYFSAVIVSPILLLAAAMQTAMYRVFLSRK
jgi:hypothetical protein